MCAGFAERMCLLRKEKGLSQRKAAEELHISQALLSHYENGAREPGLSFVCRACDYYGVSADYLLGRAEDPSGGLIGRGELTDISDSLRELARRLEEPGTPSL